MISLKTALLKNKLKQFISEHAHLKGDKELFDKTVISLAEEKKTSAHQTSDEDESGN